MLTLFMRSMLKKKPLFSHLKKIGKPFVRFMPIIHVLYFRFV